jgi:sulfide:quinone oxidoreductase
VLIDFNYEIEPVPGMFPLPVTGPMSLLKETRMDHPGKLAFKHLYWNLLLPWRPLWAPHEHGRQAAALSATGRCRERVMPR